MENFDDLFNEFLGKNDENDKDDDFLINETKKIIDMIESFKNINPDGTYTGADVTTKAKAKITFFILFLFLLINMLFFGFIGSTVS